MARRFAQLRTSAVMVKCCGRHMVPAERQVSPILERNGEYAQIGELLRCLSCKKEVLIEPFV
ncbi:MAG TPA: hypothetical protein VNK82_07230 [Terriglobales bacterium]|nr:hypothetical protein [Terriglobales bacterium]